MSNEKPNINSDNTESTIFSDPAHYNATTQTKKAPKRPLLIKVLSAILAVAVLGVGTFAAFKLIPEKKENPEKNTSISVTATSETEVKSLSLKNAKGSVTLNTQITEKDGSPSVDWTVAGVDATLTDSSSISSFSSSVLKLNALEKFAADNTDFGFSKPNAELTVSLNDGNYSLTVGKSAPSGIGYYCQLSSDKTNVYIIDGSIADSLINATDVTFAAKVGFKSVKNDKNASYFNENSLIKFDYISISGKKHPTPFKIEYLDDTDYNSFFSFKMVSPTVRICDNDVPQAVLDAFAAGFSSSGAYCYTPTAEDIKKYGLDIPDYIVTLCLNGEEYTVKFTMQNDGYAAFVDGKTDMIQKVSVSNIAFATNSIESYYSKFVVLENLNGIKQLKIETPEGSYVFDVKYTETPEGQADQYEVKFGNTVLDIKNFKTYYGTMVDFAPISFDTIKVGSPYVKITFIHSSDIKDTVLTFTKASSLRYQAEIDGIPVGQITSTILEKFISDTEKVSVGETVK